jgi:HrpA-like RNA helicase
MAATEPLPIMAYKSEILASTAEYLIIEAETGSGKTTMVPRWFMERGDRVLVAIPLIEAIIGTAEYVADQMGIELGQEVGYHTSLQKCYDWERTRLLFCTTGLALMRELGRTGGFNVLMLDEIHQWSVEQETLEAWAWQQRCEAEGPFEQIVVLSATMQADKLAQARNDAPVMTVPGRSYPIEDRPRARRIAQDVQILVREGHDVLVFLPGQAEIYRLQEELTDKLAVDAYVFPFLASMRRQEKDVVYMSQAVPRVILSTNALETGRTLVPSDGRKLAVVDSGLERRMEVGTDGIEVLVKRPIARATAEQRRGRTGRVGPGIYIDHCPRRQDERAEYPVPEIQRCRIECMVIRLAWAGYNAETLPFFHAVEPSILAHAQETLMALGAFEEDGRTPTPDGRLFAQMPVAVECARMLIEAKRLGVTGDILTLVSIMHVRGIRLMGSDTWRALIPNEHESELMAELALWQMADGAEDHELVHMGIDAAAFRRSEAARLRLFNRLDHIEMNNASSGDRDAILKACLAGWIRYVYHRIPGTTRYRGRGACEYTLTRRWVGDRESPPEWVIAEPRQFDRLQCRSGADKMDALFGERKPRHRLVLANAVSLDWLLRHAPHIVSVHDGAFLFYGAPLDYETEDA